MIRFNDETNLERDDLTNGYLIYRWFGESRSRNSFKVVQ